MSTPASAANAPLPREPGALPRHVAIIMDGNGRWATNRSLPRSAGHRAGVKATRAVVRACAERGIETLTLFAFSSENWERPRREVGLLMTLFAEALRNEVAELDRNDVRLEFIGNRDALNPQLQKLMVEAEQTTRENSGLRLVIAVSYGGRWDLTQAAKQLAADARDGKLDPDHIGEEHLHERLELTQLPDPDLFIRTGGERRVSNFLLWNLAYTELHFTDCLWPDFDAAALDEALEFFAHRERRFGRLVGQAPGA
ncbi:MAG: polyprenyl diphosphate synthase [Pseudomonadota bacterium]